MADRIFKFENRNVRIKFCRFMNKRLDIGFTQYHVHYANALLINSKSKTCTGIYDELMRHKAYKLITDDLIDAMSIILDDDALIEFLFS